MKAEKTSDICTLSHLVIYEMQFIYHLVIYEMQFNLIDTFSVFPSWKDAGMRILQSDQPLMKFTNLCRKCSQTMR